jgi:hypothetical protein
LYLNRSFKQFTTGINNTSGTGGKTLPPVLLIPVANLPPMLLTPVVNFHLRKSPRNFEKNRNDPDVIFGGLGEDDS